MLCPVRPPSACLIQLDSERVTVDRSFVFELHRDRLPETDAPNRFGNVVCADQAHQVAEWIDRWTCFSCHHPEAISVDPKYFRPRTDQPLVCWWGQTAVLDIEDVTCRYVELFGNPIRGETPSRAAAIQFIRKITWQRVPPRSVEALHPPCQSRRARQERSSRLMAVD